MNYSYTYENETNDDNNHVTTTTDGQQILWIASNVVLIVSGVTSFVTSLLTAFIIVFSKKVFNFSSIDFYYDCYHFRSCKN